MEENLHQNESVNYIAFVKNLTYHCMLLVVVNTNEKEHNKENWLMSRRRLCHVMDVGVFMTYTYLCKIYMRRNGHVQILFVCVCVCVLCVTYESCVFYWREDNFGHRMISLKSLYLITTILQYWQVSNVGQHNLKILLMFLEDCN